MHDFSSRECKSFLPISRQRVFIHEYLGDHKANQYLEVEDFLSENVFVEFQAVPEIEHVRGKGGSTGTNIAVLCFSETMQLGCAVFNASEVTPSSMEAEHIVQRNFVPADFNARSLQHVPMNLTNGASTLAIIGAGNALCLFLAASWPVRLFSREKMKAEGISDLFIYRKKNLRKVPFVKDGVKLLLLYPKVV